MIEEVRRPAFLVPNQVGADVGDKFGEGIGEVGHSAKGGLVHPAMFRAISQDRKI